LTCPRINHGSIAIAVLTLLIAAAVQAQTLAEPTISFREVSVDWGIDFRHHHGGAGDFYMPESMGAGAVIFDFDDDGDQDVFLVDAAAMPRYEGDVPRSRLFRNDGPGRFVDVTGLSGIELTAYGMGATAADVDLDGDTDLYVTEWGSNQLFLNGGNGRFRDATATAGVGGGEAMWSTSAAFGDLDGDIYPDLYVANYVAFSLDNNPICGHKELDLRSYCHPDVYDGQLDRYFRNNGDGTFTEAAEAVGIGEPIGKGLGVIFGDINRDGLVDLYVANDMTANYLFENRGDGRVEEVGLFSGVAFSDQGAPEAGMGVDLADTDGDGFDELIVTHLDMQSNALYSSSAAGLFMDRRYEAELANPSRMKVGFGVAFADLDCDTDVDLAVANGHIIHNIDLYGTGSTYKQRNQAFRNDGRGRFSAVAEDESGFEAVRASRGLAVGDLDGDHDLDIVVNNLDDDVEVYENLATSCDRWLLADLAPHEISGLGLRLELVTADRRQVREVRSASSYLSQNARPVHFGLSDEFESAYLQLWWPGGRRQALRGFSENRSLLFYLPGGLSAAAGGGEVKANR
jgi:hypothetical protein